MSGRQSLWAWSAVAVAVTVFLGVLFSKPKTPDTSALVLLPGEPLAAFHFEGLHDKDADVQKTAAYRAVIASGLSTALDKLLKAGLAMANIQAEDPELTDKSQFLANHIARYGIAGAISTTGEGQSLAPYAVFVLPELASGLPAVTSVLSRLTGPTTVWKNEQANGKSVTRGEWNGIPVSFWADAAHLVIALGTGAESAALEAAAGRGISLAANPHWKSFSSESGDVYLAHAWGDVHRVVKLVEDRRQSNQPGNSSLRLGDVLDAIGLSSFAEVDWRLAMNGPAIVTQTKVAIPGPKVGIAKLFDQPALSLKDVPPVPADANAVYVSSLDLAGIVKETLAVTDRLASFLPESDREELHQLRPSLNGLNRDLGVDIVSDVLEALGSGWAIYDDPRNGVLGIGLGMAVQVRDSEKLKASLTSISKNLVTSARRVGIFFERRTEDADYFVIKLPESPVFPTIGISDKWLAIGLQPQAVRSFFLRASGKLPSFSYNSLPRESRALLSDGFTSLQIADTTAIVSFLMTSAPMGANMLEADLRRRHQPIPTRSLDWPPSELVTAPLFANVSVTRIEGSGMHSRSRESLPGLPLMGSGPASSSVIAALLLPAVQQARSASRRTVVTNNLKQIGLALHNYESTYRKLPRGVRKLDGVEPEESLSWMVDLLPYIEQSSLANRIKPDAGYADPANAFLKTTLVPQYRNPAYPATNSGEALSHYVGIAGVGEQSLTDKLPNNKTGVFGYFRSTSFREISDGLSNTMMVTEGTPERAGPWSRGGPSTIRALTKRPSINGPDGIGGSVPGGVQVLIGDGSVRFISKDVDPALMEKLATHSGGETLDPDF